MLAFGQTSNTSTEFVPLTNIPALTDLGTGFTLEAFLNGLFRIAIGAAAVIAVLQIMRAGIMYMASDSGFAEKKEAKNLIGLAIGGLVLVLSPVIVFSIINPEILSLKIGGIEKLRPEPGATTTPTVVAPAGGGNGPGAPPPIIPATGEVNGACSVYRNGQVIPASDTIGEQCCGAQRSQTVECSVSWNYSSQPYVKSCGCSFRGVLASPLRYQVWRLNTEEGGMTDPRIMPKYGAAVEQYGNTCRQSGGTVEDKFLGFLERSAACDKDSGLAPLTKEGDRYICQNKEMTCK